jgi:hypothetical protein
MNHSRTYSPNRLQKAIGNIAGTHLGFNPRHDGSMKPLPQTSAEIVEIKKIYPTCRSVDFCFMGSDTLHTAQALLDYWHREGTDKFQPPETLKLPSNQNESAWPFTTPETNSPDLMTIGQLILLSGAPTAPNLPPIIQALIQKMGGQQNTVKLLQKLTGSGSLNIEMLLKIIGLDTTLKKSSNIEELTKKIITDDDKINVPNIPPVETPNTLNMGLVPQEPLHGTVIPLKGDKTQGYLLLGFIKL